MARALKDVRDALYLGRGINMPIAYEGALKLKEISYIHAEAYPAGEMKHGPIALVDKDMPVVAIAPQDPWYEKMISQIEQAKARGGQRGGGGDRRRRDGRQPGGPRLLGAGCALDAQPGGDGDPAAAAGVPHRLAGGAWTSISPAIWRRA